MTIRNIKAVFAAALLCLLLCFCAVMGGQDYLSAFAAADVQTYENTNVLDDLEGSTIAGKEFDIADYPHNDNGQPQVISLVEFCYSYYADKQEDFGLYIYLYNPQDVAFDMATDRNKIQLTYGDKQSYSKYTLEFLNYSEKAGYEGRFYKFKICLSETERLDILNTVDDDGRVYKISGIELSYKGTVTEYVCAQTYTYTGYAEGYGSELATGDTLACKVDGFDKYLTLDVHSTYYRPEGTNGEAYGRDTLHSVYFSVPNEIVAEYGEMTAVHATWLNARTSPIFVTGDETVYNAVRDYLGQYVDGGDYHLLSDANKNNDLQYSLIASKYIESAGWNNASYGFSYMSYNANRRYTNSDVDLYTLAYCFLADNGNADDYTLPAEALVGNKKEGVKGWFEEYSAEYGGDLINDRFSSALFSEVAETFTDVTITADDTFKLTDEQISQSWWQQFVGGGYNVTGTTEYLISAIKQVSADDFKSTVHDTCERLYIAESDYDEFKAFYDKATKSDETVYLFRYAQTEYVSYKVAVYSKGDDGALIKGFGYDYVNSNAYFAEMWAQLDFDIIDVTMTKDGVDTVIPVIMSPMDIVADGAPPVVIPRDITWWEIVLMVVALLLIIILLEPILPYILKAIIWVVMLPFKAIAALVNAIRKAVTKKPKTATSSPVKAVKDTQPKTVYVKSDKPKQGKEKQNK